MRHRPLLLWVAAFALGIGLRLFGCFPIAVIVVAALLGLAAMTPGARHTPVFLAGVVFAACAAGGLRTAAFQTIPVDDISHWANQKRPVTITGPVLSDPDRRAGRQSFFVRAERIETDSGVQSVTGEVFVSVSSGRGPESLQSMDYGENLRLTGRLETPRGATNPGGFSWRDYLARRAVYCQLHPRWAGAIRPMGSDDSNLLLRSAWAVRRYIQSAITASLPPIPASVLSGILIGQRQEISPALMSAYVQTGTVHLLASAGLHVGVLIYWLMFVFARLTLPRKLSAGLILTVLWLYVFVCGGHPAVTRAVLMATIYFGALLFEREPDLPTTVGVAALVILSFQPTVLLEAGFQLSFLTVMTLAICMPLWEEFWKPRVLAWIPNPRGQRMIYRLLELAGVTLFAQIGSAPIVAAFSNELSLCGIFANAIVVPVLFLLIPMGFLSVIAWLVWHPLGAFLFPMVGILVGFINGVIGWFAGQPWAVQAIPTPSPILVAACYGLIWGVAWWVGQEKGGKTEARTADDLVHWEPVLEK